MFPGGNRNSNGPLTRISQYRGLFGAQNNVSIDGLAYTAGEYSCAVRFSPNGKQLLLTPNKVARLYDTKTWRYRDLKLPESR